MEGYQDPVYDPSLLNRIPPEIPGVHAGQAGAQPPGTGAFPGIPVQQLRQHGPHVLDGNGSIQEGGAISGETEEPESQGHQTKIPE